MGNVIFSAAIQERLKFFWEDSLYKWALIFQWPSVSYSCYDGHFIIEGKVLNVSKLNEPSNQNSITVPILIRQWILNKKPLL